MHGLINTSIQTFLCDTYGGQSWSAVASAAGLCFDSFDAMTSYGLADTEAVIAAAALVLDRPPETLMEDFGTWLISSPSCAAPRRLLRFGGVTFVEFLHSLEDMPARARLALPDLLLPDLQLTEDGAQTYTLTCRSALAGSGHVLVGLLRAMADDYGALVVLDHRGGPSGEERIVISVPEPSFAAGRRFRLAGAGQP